MEVNVGGVDRTVRIILGIVLLSLFTSGMKMSLGLHDKRWFPPLRLALGSMLATVLLITVAGVALLGLRITACGEHPTWRSSHCSSQLRKTLLWVVNSSATSLPLAVCR